VRERAAVHLSISRPVDRRTGKRARSGPSFYRYRECLS
jgi:hypothetical protein